MVGVSAPLTFQSALLRIARLPVDRAATLEEAFGWITSISGHALQVARVGVWLLSDGGERLVCADLCETSTMQHQRGTELKAADFPRYFRAVASDRSLAVQDAQSDPSTSEFTDVYLIPHGITSMLDSPIFHEGKLIGVVCHEHVGPKREWSETEIAFAASVADLVSLVREEHEHRQTEAALSRERDLLRQAQKMEALGRFAGGVAHDFNNLLTAMMGYAQIIAGKVGKDPQVQNAVNKLLQVSEQGVAMTQRLLAFSHNHPAELPIVDVHHVIGGMESLLRPLLGEKWTLVLEIDPHVGGVRADATHLVQAVLNLVINARDAMPSGGTVVLSALRIHSTGSGIRIIGGCGELPVGSWVAISVRDHGHGIDESVRAHLFEPFFTTKPRGKGTGLGLATVWGVVEQCQGAIAVESSRGAGTAMTLYFRCADGRL